MKKKLRNAALLTLCLAVLVSFGCNKKRIKGLVPAHGVVTLNGEPVAGAMVMFTPVKVGPEAFAASTTTDAQGAFKMTTLDPGDGVYPGEYNVTVVKDEMQGGMTLEESKQFLENPDEARRSGLLDKEALVIHHLPPKYANVNTADLKVVVPEGGKKDITLALEGEVDLTPQKQSGPPGGPGR